MKVVIQKQNANKKKEINDSKVIDKVTSEEHPKVSLKTKMKMHPKQKIKGATGVRIDPRVSLELKRQAWRQNCSQGEYISMMLNFFNVTGISPTDYVAGQTSLATMGKVLSETIAEMHKDISEKIAEYKDKVEQTRSNVWAAKTQYEKHSNGMLREMSMIRDDIKGSNAELMQVSKDIVKALSDVKAIASMISDAGGQVTPIIRPQVNVPIDQFTAKIDADVTKRLNMMEQKMQEFGKKIANVPYLASIVYAIFGEEGLNTTSVQRKTVKKLLRL